MGVEQKCGQARGNGGGEHSAEAIRELAQEQDRLRNSNGVRVYVVKVTSHVRILA